jgi:hypothetical protein
MRAASFATTYANGLEILAEHETQRLSDGVIKGATSSSRCRKAKIQTFAGDLTLSGQDSVNP